MLPFRGDQGRGAETWPGTLKTRRWEVELVRGAAAEERGLLPEMEGGGGTGSRGKTPTGPVEAMQPLKTRPASRMAERDTE